MNAINNQKAAEEKINKDSAKNSANEGSPVREFEKRRKSKDVLLKNKCNLLNEDTNRRSPGKENILLNGATDLGDKEIEDTAEINKDAEEENLDAKSEERENNLLNEEVLRKTEELCAEEEKLEQEIMELEKTEIEVDTETEETETDGEAAAGPGDEEDERPEFVTP
ncbi:hypothetical protein J437_LFUL009380, partial [Ladona fulva]